MSYEPPALFVAWRDPETRRIYPVGRLLRLVGSFRGYEFGYIAGARVASETGFQPFLAFPKLDQVYRSRELLPFFKNRVLSPTRPDYPEYIQSLALDASVAEPLTLLAVSGGRRDLVEIFPDWTLEPAGERIQTRLLVRGVQHVPGAEERIERLHPGEALHCKRDLENRINPQAIRLRTEDGIDIGFVPDYLAADLTALLDTGAEIDVRVQRVNPPPVPRHHRVLCVLSTRAGVGVVGYRGETFRPLSSEATGIEDRVATPVPPAVAAGL